MKQKCKYGHFTLSSMSSNINQMKLENLLYSFDDYVF